MLFHENTDENELLEFGQLMQTIEEWTCKDIGAELHRRIQDAVEKQRGSSSPGRLDIFGLMREVFYGAEETEAERNSLWRFYAQLHRFTPLFNASKVRDEQYLMDSLAKAKYIFEKLETLKPMQKALLISRLNGLQYVLSPEGFYIKSIKVLERNPYLKIKDTSENLLITLAVPNLDLEQIDHRSSLCSGIWFRYKTYALYSLMGIPLAQGLQGQKVMGNPFKGVLHGAKAINLFEEKDQYFSFLKIGDETYATIIPDKNKPYANRIFTRQALHMEKDYLTKAGSLEDAVVFSCVLQEYVGDILEDLLHGNAARTEARNSEPLPSRIIWDGDGLVFENFYVDSHTNQKAWGNKKLYSKLRLPKETNQLGSIVYALFLCISGIGLQGKCADFLRENAASSVTAIENLNGSFTDNRGSSFSATESQFQFRHYQESSLFVVDRETNALSTKIV